MKTNLLKFFFGILCLSNLCFAQVTNGLIAHYPLDGNANEASLGCNNGTNNGALSTFNSCNMPNTAMSFNGTSNYVEVADCPNLHVANGLSVCAWVKPKAFYAGNNQGNYIVSRGVDYSAGSFALTYHDGVADANLDPTNERFNFLLGGMSGQPFNIANVRGTTVAQLNVWHFVVGTFNGTQMKIYVNAMEEGTTNLLANIAINTDNLLIGKHKYPVGYWVNGDIDDVRLYNRALSQQEIQTLYDQHCWATGIENEEFINVIQVYPNPIESKLTVKWDNIIPKNVVITDITGKILFEKALQNITESETLSLSNFVKGIYFLRVQTDKETYTQKIVKE